MRLEWSPSAIADLEAIQRCIAADDLGAAGQMRKRLEAAGARILTQPRMGRIGKLAGSRECVVPRNPYLLVYRLQADVVQILRVMHGAQRWPPT